MDETSLAFGQPLARAEATAETEALDRISVRDFVRDVDIGAFQSERGVTQRLRFNVVLEVAHHHGAADDDVDQIISYDTITDAIEAELQKERMNLLETLAEHVAERCLLDPRAVRVFVRIEKLDRIPGALGVEIMRKRVVAGDKIQPIEAARAVVQEDQRPVVIFLPSDLIDSPKLVSWLNVIDGLEYPAIISLEPMEHKLPEVIPPLKRRIGLLAMEQNAWVLADKDERCVVVETRTELEWAANQGHMSVWAPSKIALDAVHRPKVDARQPRRFAHWFAGEIGAIALIEIGPERTIDGDKPNVYFVDANNPKVLAEIKIEE